MEGIRDGVKMAGMLYFCGRVDLRMYERVVVGAAAFCAAAVASGEQIERLQE